MKKYIKILVSVIVLCIVFTCETATVKATYLNDKTEELENAGMPLYTFDTLDEWKEWYFNNRTYKFWWLSFVYVRKCSINGVDYLCYPFNSDETWLEWWDWCWEQYDNGYLKFEFVTEQTTHLWGKRYYDDAPLEEIERINQERLKAENAENLEQLLLSEQKQKEAREETIEIATLAQEQLASADYSMKEENIFSKFIHKVKTFVIK